MTKREATTQRLKDSLANALLELMQEKPFAKITIDELTQRAQVGRVTYFRHFSNKEDVLVYKYMRLWEQWAKEYGVSTWRDFSPKNVRPFFQFHYHYRDIMRMMQRCGLRDIIQTASYNVLMNHRPHATVTEQYQARYLACGFGGILEAWVENDFAQSVDQMIAICGAK
ncbi:MAG: TetR/AcrR family transcriptional regulator [Faecalibacterium sp.]|nr:TetR/AcrR family transcriptional regulator [Faecalibacterium sp.]